MGDIDFRVISAAENSNKFQKPRFWKEKSVEDVVTLGPRAQATLVMIGSGDFLLVVSHLFGVPVLVLWGAQLEKTKQLNLDVRNISPGSNTEHCWRCSGIFFRRRKFDFPWS